MPETTHAERARLAHGALRLRESGFDSQTKIEKVAAAAAKYNRENPPNAAKVFDAVRAGDLDRAQELAAERVITPPGPVRLGGVAQAMLNALDESAEGPTDVKLVQRLMGREDLTSIWQEWDDAVTANLEATLPEDELKKWRASVNRDADAAADAIAARQETGEFPVHPAFGHMRHDAGAANALYDLGREGLADADIRLITATIKIDLVDSADYAVNLATHQFRSSVASIGRVASSGALANKTRTAGVFDADDVTLSAVTGDPSEAIVIYQASAAGGGADVADTAQRLIGYIDTATGLPVTPNGGNINVVWDSGSNRIFKL